MKKLFYFILFYFILVFNKSYASLQDGLIKNSDSNFIKGDLSEDNGLNVVSNIFVWLKTEIMSIVMVVTIGAFIYIGIKMATSRGNPEEFKKAWLHFVYAIIGVFIVFMAWGAVKLISGLSL